MPLLLEWLEEIEFFCVCVAETVLLLLLINITVYIAVVVACQNGQLNGPVNVNMIFQTVTFYLFNPVSLHKVTHRPTCK